MLQGVAVSSVMTARPARCRSQEHQTALSVMPENTLLRGLHPASRVRKAQRQESMLVSVLPAVQDRTLRKTVRQSVNHAMRGHTLAYRETMSALAVLPVLSTS